MTSQLSRPADNNRLARLWPLNLIKGNQMPAPDPFGLSYDETPSGQPLVTAEVWPSSGLFASNRRNRLKRLRAVYRLVRRDGWLCLWCKDPVPIYRRADACYCCEGCRKRAARARKAACRSELATGVSKTPGRLWPGPGR